MATYQATLDLRLTVLGDRTRRAILERLARGPVAVGELARGLPVSRPAVSQHLKVLKQAGLVVDRAEGTRRLYSVDSAGVAEVSAYFDQFWRRSLEAFKEAVERPGAAERRDGSGKEGRR